MSAYIQELYAAVEAENAKRQAAQVEKERAAAEAARAKLVPLKDRVGRVLDAIPAAVSAEGLSIMALQSQLRARGRGHSVCHIGELSDALRKKGWTRKRRNGADGYRALWYPPSKISTS
jgi:hypothetical protein